MCLVCRAPMTALVYLAGVREDERCEGAADCEETLLGQQLLPLACSRSSSDSGLPAASSSKQLQRWGGSRFC